MMFTNLLMTTIITFDKAYLADMMSKKTDISAIPNVKIHPIKRSIILDNNRSNSAASPRWNFDWCENQYQSKRKMNGVISTTNSGFWTDVDATTKHQVKGFLGIWSLVAVPHLKIIGSVYIQDVIFGGTGVVAVDGEASNDSKISFGSGNAGSWQIFAYDTQHIARVNGTDDKQCNLFR